MFLNRSEGSKQESYLYVQCCWGLAGQGSWGTKVSEHHVASGVSVAGPSEVRCWWWQHWLCSKKRGDRGSRYKVKYTRGSTKEWKKSNVCTVSYSELHPRVHTVHRGGSTSLNLIGWRLQIRIHECYNSDMYEISNYSNEVINITANTIN